MRIQCTCFTCHRPFTKRPHQISARNYCSSACWYAKGPRGAVTVLPDGTSASIPLLSDDGSIMATMLVDIADVSWITQWPWRLHDAGYAARRTRTNGRASRLFLHRELLGLVRGDGMEGDHINRNRLDNRRVNLRAVPKAGNRQNTSGRRTATSCHRGVCWDKTAGAWLAQVHAGSECMFRRYFPTEEEAAAAAREARLRLLPYAVD
jgi:hypothetical protein